MNHLLRTTALLGLAAALAVRLTGEEHNAWPVRVTQTDAAGTPRSWMSAGPFWFEKPAEGGGTVSGLRPFFVRTANAGGELREATVLYPLYLYRQDSEVYSWSIFQLINRSGPRAGTVTAPNEGAGREALDVWPFWFSRDTGSPRDATSRRIRLRSGAVSGSAWPAGVTRHQSSVSSRQRPVPVSRCAGAISRRPTLCSVAASTSTFTGLCRNASAPRVSAWTWSSLPVLAVSMTMPRSEISRRYFTTLRPSSSGRPMSSTTMSKRLRSMWRYSSAAVPALDTIKDAVRQKVIAEQQEKLTTDQATAKERLTKQYASMDSRVAAYKSTLSFLQQQVAVWTKSA